MDDRTRNGMSGAILIVSLVVNLFAVYYAARYGTTDALIFFSFTASMLVVLCVRMYQLTRRADDATE